MRFLIASLLLPLSLLAAEPAPRAPRKPVEIEDITLSDGRKLSEVAVVSHTAHTITLRHDGTVEKISKDLLPDFILRRWPVDPVLAAQEEKAIAQAEAKAAREAAAKIKRAEFRRKVAADEAAWQAKLAEQRRRDNPQSVVAKADPAEIARLQSEARAQELARSRDGVQLRGFGYWPARNAVTLTVANVADNYRSLDWRQLRAIATDGRVLEPLDVIFEVSESASYDVAHGKARSFTVVFPAASIAALSWSDRADLGWIDYQGKSVTTDVAIAATRERNIAARRANKSGNLQAVTGQVVQK